jgi:GxxExxY protein
MIPVEARDPQTYAVIGAAMEVHREAGSGLLEAAYQEMLAVELELRGIPFEREVELPIHYKGRKLNCKYRADFVCYGDLLIETKAVRQLTAVDRAQTIHYLKITRYLRALLFNFGSASLEYERVAYTPGSPLSSSSAQSV